MPNYKSKDFLYDRDLSQVFITDKHYLQKIENELNIHEKNVTEIGPGSGNITNLILKKSIKSLTLIEKDKRFISNLKQNYRNVTIICDDCLNLNIENEIIISNLPFNISNEFLFKCFLNNVYEKMYLILQEEFALKLLNSQDNKLALLMNLSHDIKILLTIPSGSFFPKPQINACLVLFVKKDIQFNKIKASNLAHRIFQNKNKKLQNLIPDLPVQFLDKRIINLNINDFLLILKN